ncbi:hypothetical protein AALP_AA1G219800 [Arabis alpina]|nr:hypothetical protein AALP_AA1G219800 [Arabis alpina]
MERLHIVSSKKVHRKEKRKEKKQKIEKSLKLQYYPTKQQVTDESEQLEKSCLTEENEQQLHSVGYLSDGSQNSKKRIREEASPAVESSNIKATHVAGNPLRIRFVFKKPKEAEVLPQEEDRVCSTSGAERLREIPIAAPSSKTCDPIENLLSTSLESDKIAIPSELKRRKKHKPSKESRYSTLFDECVLPCISLEKDDSNSDDWLFGTRRQENASTKATIKKDGDMITSGDYSLPRARFLTEVDIFSLPYTVPF